MFTEVAPGIFSVDHRWVEGKNGIVIGERPTLAIDVGTYPDEGEAMEVEIEVLVSGHGAVLHGTEIVRGWLEWLADYLARVRAFVRDELCQGRDPEDVADLLDMIRSTLSTVVTVGFEPQFPGVTDRLVDDLGRQVEVGFDHSLPFHKLTAQFLVLPLGVKEIGKGVFDPRAAQVHEEGPDADLSRWRAAGYQNL